MNEATLTSLIGGFRLRMACANLSRWVLLAALLLGFAATGPLGTAQTARAASGGLAMVLVGWLLMVIVSVRAARNAQIGAVLLIGGHWDEAERELVRAMRSVSVFRGVMLTAAQHLGLLLRSRQDHVGARRIFEVLLQYTSGRFGTLRRFQTSLRLLLADCELALGNLHGAHEAFAPVFGLPLTLSERLMLLPIELRYELATGHTVSAVANLAEKVRHAELLDSPQAAWVHSLLAEACRREGMPARAEYLQRRAELYHDLDKLPAAMPLPMIEPLGGAGV